MEKDCREGSTSEEQQKQAYQQGSFQTVCQEDHSGLHCKNQFIQKDQEEMRQEIEDKLEEVDQPELDYERRMLASLKKLSFETEEDEVIE